MNTFLLAPVYEWLCYYFTTTVVRKSDLLQRLSIQPRDIRFSTATSLYQRGTSIILRLQEVKAIIRSDSLILLDSDHHAIQELLPELEVNESLIVNLRRSALRQTADCAC